MQPYLSLHSHCIGKSHRLRSKPCEDYSLSYSDTSMTAAIVSDGHGDANCFRSAAGARFACEICLNTLRQFQGVTSHIIDIRSCDFEQTVHSLEREIASKWRRKVIADIQENPFSGDELEQASDGIRAQYLSGQNTELAYGCTLLAAMVTKHYFLCLQIGDGKCVSAYPGGIFVEPVPDDENCVGNRSTSLCSRNAELLFRHYFSPVLPLAAFVVSDGVEESFDTAGLYSFFYSAACWCAQEGADCAAARLGKLLPQISEGGSGDDVSLACYVSSEGELSPPKQPLAQVYQRVNALAGHLEQLDDRLLRENELIEETTRRIERTEGELASLRKALAEKEKAYSLSCEECDGLKAAFRELQQKRDAAAEQMGKAEAYRQTAEKFWFAEYKKLGISTSSDSVISDRSDDSASAAPKKSVFPDEEQPSVASSEGEAASSEQDGGASL